WALSANLLFINRYDSIIAFYGRGYRHLFDRELQGGRVAPGEQFNYQFGVGAAANDRVTLSPTLQSFDISKSLIPGAPLRVSNLERLSVRFAATVARRERIIEPFVQVGMTEAAPASSIGITVTFY